MSGAVLKPVQCECCQTEFLYLARRKGVGSGLRLFFLDNEGAEARAGVSAEANLKASLGKAVDAVACPSCGCLQQDMIRQGKRSRFRWTLGIGLFAAALLFLRGLAIYWFDPIVNAANLPAEQKWPIFVAAMTSVYVYWAVGIGVLSIVGSVAWRMVYNPNAASPLKLAARTAASRGVLLATVRERLAGVSPESRTAAIVGLLAEREQATKRPPRPYLWLAGLLGFVVLMLGIGAVMEMRLRAEKSRQASAGFERAAQALNAADLAKCRAELLQCRQLAADSKSRDVRGQWEQIVQTCLEREFAEVRKQSCRATDRNHVGWISCQPTNDLDGPEIESRRDSATWGQPLHSSFSDSIAMTQVFSSGFAKSARGT